MTALIRATEAAGGHATVLAKGDPVAGALLVLLAERGAACELVERAPAWGDGPTWIGVGPKDLAEPGALTDYLARRRANDPDLWAVEVDASGARALLDKVIDPPARP